MSDYNRVGLAGRLTQTAELKQGTASPVLTFSIASNRESKNPTGVEVKEVSYIDIVVYGKYATALHPYLQRGRLVIVDGRLKQSKWQDAQGQAKGKLQVIAESVQLLTPTGAQQQTQPPQPQPYQQYQQQPQNTTSEEVENIPFY